jgi:DNA-binding transcriptional ArsR family regulator
MTSPRRALVSLDAEGFELEADVIRVMANPKRLMIVSFLGEGPRTVTEIADRLHLSMQNASQHLRLMKDRGIVRAHRDGREVRYDLTTPVFSQCCQLVRQAILSEAKTRPAHFGWGDSMTEEPVAGGLVETNRTRHPIKVTG